ncbi:MAG: sulfotransferase family 2 domain-containing protein [Leptolyngbyaceae cyanobacterium T60_A2020_046]|nr:sulfotransferase family 2 domain-containing protein [Leptolyngbyaceae cyanobacterium T60_A2020_046]
MKKILKKSTIQWGQFKFQEALGRLTQKKRLHFLHIGKTGGSVTKDALRSLSGNRRFSSSPDYFIYLYRHDFTLQDVPQGEGVIVFLRDPITRFTSGFYSRLREGKPKFNVPWSRNEKIAFGHFSTPNQLALALGAKDPEERARAEHAMTHIGHIKKPYSFWLKDAEYLHERRDDLFFIGFQEQLSHDFEALKAKLGLPEGLNLRADEVGAHKTPGHFDRHLNPDAIANIQAWYATDYKIVEACQSIRAELISAFSEKK